MRIQLVLKNIVFTCIRAALLLFKFIHDEFKERR
jgi:hypothetical protein